MVFSSFVNMPINEAGDDASMTARHGVLAVRRHADQLGMPLHV
jgi:hypothetical protein